MSGSALVGAAAAADELTGEDLLHLSEAALSSHGVKAEATRKRASAELVYEAVGEAERALLKPLCALTRMDADALLAAGKLDLDRKVCGDPERVAAVGVLLRHSIALRTLDCPRNQLGVTGAAALAQQLSTNTTLTALNLDANQIGDEGAAALAQLVSTNTTLTELHLDDNKIGIEGAAALAQMLSTNATLTELSLYDNQISDEGAAAITRLLARNVETAARKCWAAVRVLLDSMAAAGARVLLEPLCALAREDADEESDLDDELDEMDADALLAAEELSLHDRMRGNPERMAAVGVLLKHSTALRTLDLRNNEIGDEGAATFAQLISTNATLTTLYLHANQIGKEGAPPWRS
jgi:Leucine-rich repeat (LRR) protein